MGKRGVRHMGEMGVKMKCLRGDRIGSVRAAEHGAFDTSEARSGDKVSGDRELARDEHRLRRLQAARRVGPTPPVQIGTPRWRLQERHPIAVMVLDEPGEHLLRNHLLDAPRVCRLVLVLVALVRRRPMHRLPLTRRLPVLLGEGVRRVQHDARELLVDPEEDEPLEHATVLLEIELTLGARELRPVRRRLPLEGHHQNDTRLALERRER